MPIRRSSAFRRRAREEARPPRSVRQAPSAASTPSSSTSTWVTIRTCVPTWVTPTPRAASRSTVSSTGIPTASVSTNTMFVSTCSRSIEPGRRSPTPSARVRARAWSSCSRGGPSSSATMPAAAVMPACRHAPPNRMLNLRASRMRSAGPQITDPIGAPRPFDRQNITVSTCCVQAVGSTPAAPAALNTLAPSMWTGTPASVATDRTFASSSTGITAPAAAPTVFSTVRRSTISTS